MRNLASLLILVVPLGLPGFATAQDIRTFTGTAHNVSVGVQAGVTLQVILKADGTYELIGAFDNISLAGSVSGSGRAPTSDAGDVICAEGHECILFDGAIILGPDAGFEVGTTSDFVLHLDLDTTGAATGAYHIGPLPGFTFEQYGTVTLSAPVS